jgi:hypothetical protein
MPIILLTIRLEIDVIFQTTYPNFFEHAITEINDKQ